jgi:malonate transporter MadL subunit
MVASLNVGQLKKPSRPFMIIYGVAILATCTLIGLAIGQLFGLLCGVDANIGGVGFAMLLLIFASRWLNSQNSTSSASVAGIQFWSGMYVPIVVAMAASQNVVGAVRGGAVALLAGLLAAASGFAFVAWLGRIGKAEEQLAKDNREDMS